MRKDLSLRNLLTGPALAGFLLFTGCGEPTAPEIREVAGRVVWDLNEDGTYAGTPEAIVTIYSKGDTTTIGTLTGENGEFSLLDVPSGNRNFQILKIHSLRVYQRKGEFYVGEGRTDLGDIELEKTFSFPPPWYKIFLNSRLSQQ